MKNILAKFGSYEARLRRLRGIPEGLRGLRKGLNTKELEEQYLCYLNAGGQRGELSALMIPESQLVLRQQLDQTEYQRLLELLKTIRRNRQRVRKILFSILGILVVCVLAVMVFLRSSLLAEFIEARLTKILGAPVHIYSPILHWNGVLEYENIYIGMPGATTEGNMQAEWLQDNQILELGAGVLKFSFDALLQKKLILTEFFSETIQLGNWQGLGLPKNSKDLEVKGQLQEAVRLETDGILDEAKQNFSSFQTASRLTQNFSTGENWARIVRQGQGSINENSNLLNQINGPLVTLENGNVLQRQSRNLTNQLEQQIYQLNRQIRRINSRSSSSNQTLNTINDKLNEDFQALQRDILSGGLLQAPVSVLIDHYLTARLRNFGEISLWLAAVLRNLRQYQFTSPDSDSDSNSKFAPSSSQKSFHSIFPQEVKSANDNIYNFPALFYPNFAIQYFKAGRKAQPQLQVLSLSSDGDLAQSPVIAIFQDLDYRFRLLYENRRFPVRLQNYYQSNDYSLLDSTLLEEEYEGSQAHFQYNKSQLSIPDRFFVAAGLDFIRSYSADLDLNITLKESNKVDSASNGNPELEVELHAKFSNSVFDIDNNLNALQQALVAILFEYPIDVLARFSLSETKPHELLRLQTSSNIKEILASTLEDGNEGVQNAIYILRVRLEAELRNIIEPLQKEIANLSYYRLSLQRQSYRLNQQKNEAERAFSRIEDRIQRLKNLNLLENTDNNFDGGNLLFPIQ